MTTVISPASGHGAMFTQGGVGATPGYDAIDLRRSMNMGLQEGVVEAGAWKVSQRSAGANMSVDIAAATGFALVKGDAVTGQGLYTVPPHSAVINEAIGAADATNPRVDVVVLEIRDNTHDSSGANEARVRVVAGTATSGATLDNRTGAASVPSSAILLADVLVSAGVSSIVDAKIRDRRPWARGALAVVRRTSGSYTSPTGASVGNVIDATNIAVRVECSGVPIRVRLLGAAATNGQYTAEWGLTVDGTDQAERASQTSVTSDARFPIAGEWVFTPSAGSHTIAANFGSPNTGAIVTVEPIATRPLVFVVEELLRPSASNT